MRKILLLLMVFTGLHLSAKEFTYEGIIYTVIDEAAKTVQTKEGSEVEDPEDSSKTIHVPGNTISGILQLPETVTDADGTEYTVTNIGVDSFSSNSFLYGVWLPETVKQIGKNAFYGCTNLIRIELSPNLSDIGEYAFFGCISLQDITLPEGIYIIREGTFAGCYFKKFELPKTLLGIYDYAFMLCTNLTEIKIPDTVILMGNSCFLAQLQRH